MALINRLISSLYREKDGQALVEYALILALVAVVVIVVLHFLGHSVSHTLNNVGTSINNATTTG
ncbi:Flp family type IVb pilin [Sulfobacillus sp. DSM 109850]|uniref:Flp family type IVb pilin n=2 Tax=Sulfobacillus harzensis TaxID=2729629 RepID=A0A7Y0Q4V6_9FIRM|nr:Flp family type IVb pilin [Sulfobacillus harzensis]